MRQVAVASLILFSLTAAAQLEGFDGNTNLTSSDMSMFRSFDNRYEGIRGFPTLFENFTEGTVELKNGATAKRVDINVDIVAGELLLKSRTINKVLAVQTNKVKSFIFIDKADGDMEFINVDGLGFCQEMYAGKLKLYLKRTKYVEKANYGGAYSDNARRYDEFVAEDKYFIVKGDAAPEEIKLTRKTVEKIFPDKSDEIRGYYKSNKPDLKNTDDIVLLFRFLEGDKPVNP